MLKNRTKIKVKGLNQERAINNLSKTIKIYNFSRKEHNVSEFEVDYNNSKHIKKMLEGQGLEVVSLKSRGPAFFIKEFFKRGGLIAGIIFALIFYILQYSFILKIEVWGGEASQCSLVKNFIEDNLDSKLKYNISTEELEILVRNNFDFVSSVSVAFVGQSIVVNLNPSLLPDEMGTGFSPLVSEYDGMITEINLIQGTLNCSVGDIVQKGDVLVYPYVTDSSGKVYEVEPKADITAQVWLSGQEIHYDYRILTYRTGKSKVQSQVLLGGLMIYSKTPDILFENYECEVYTKQLTKNLLLPFKLKKTIYYEIATEEIIEPFEEVKEEIISKARQKALIFSDKNDIIIDEKYTLSEGGGCHIVDYVVTVSKNIGG